MKPILIDGRVVKNLGLLAVLITVSAFAGGYLLGYQQAKDLFAAGDETGSLFFSTNDTDAAGGDIEQHVPEVVDAAEDIKPSVNTDEVATKADAEITEENAKPETIETRVASASPVDNKPEKQITSDKPIKIKFSIQVGIYGSLKNAEKMKRKLQAQNLDAYISSFRNKDNKLRFNVRFGYFENLKYANIALDDYKNVKKGSGYVVNFSDKNIINSDADDIKPIAKEAVSKPADAAVDISVHKAPEKGDTLPVQEVMTESQSQGLAN